MPGQRSIKLCLILFIIGMLISPSYSAPVVVAQEQPPAQNLHIERAHPLPPQAQVALPAGIEEPLPHDCDGITPPGQPAPACCLYGYVFYAQKPLPGAIVQIASPHGSIIVTTTVGGASSEPYYGVNLSAPPLSVTPGEAMTITASYGVMTSIRVWTVQNGGQQVDLGLVANYRMATPVGAAAATPDLSTIQPADIRPMAAGGAPFGSGMAIVTSADGARAVYAVDVDRDGDLDVLSASADDHTIAWHENNGSSPPILTTHIITTTASGARSVYAADVNGDGRMDVLSASANDDTIAWYENLGGSPPAFAGHIVATTADGASAVYAVDLDRDGDMDILAASANDDTIAWYENDGGVSPLFTARIIASTADGAAGVYAADVNGDGRIDVLLASANDGTIAWYENNGGAPLTFTPHTVATGADGASHVYAADVNDDGNMDILSASANDNEIVWYESGGGSTPAFTAHVVTATASGAASVYAVDVDRDGDMDILSASTNDDRVVWYENDGGPSPTFTAHVLVPAADGASSVYAADLDGDGDIDILSASANDDRIAWYPNLSIHRSASFPVQSVITDTAQAARSVYATDLDSDGDVDVLSASYYNQIVWYENQGGSPPTFAGHVITATTGGSDFATVYAVDVDGDGDMDVLSASSGNDRIAWYENMGGSPLTFTGHIITSTANGAASVYAADVDRDGDMDVLAASHDDNTIAWYENDGSSPPVFVGHIITSTAGGAVSVYAADVDGDGDADILSAAQYSDTIAWHENLGGSPPTFIDHIITTSADDARQVYAADVDQDGDMDVLSVSHTGNKIAWYENDGGSPPSFVVHILTTGAKAPRSVYVTDLDHDGDMDILSASRDDDRIAWYENIGGSPLAFITHTITTQADAAWSVYAADLDNDGDVDAMSASNSDNKIAWYENRGGQFAWTVADTTPFTILPGQRDDLLRIVAAHRGRAGDLDAEWLMLKLRFEDTLGNPLTAAQANALIKTLFIYRDDGSGNFEPASDTLMTTVDTLTLVTGTQTISFVHGDPNVRIAFGAPVTYFVAIEPTDDQIQQTTDQFQMILVSGLENGSVSDNIARYWDYDLPLSPETSPNVAIGLLTSPRIYAPDIAVPFGDSADRTYDIAWADADLDGHMDLAVGSYGPNQMCWNNGDGSFTCEEPFGNGMTVSIAWGDMNRDGWPDLVIGSASGRPNQVCLNNQDRSFTCTGFSACTGNTCYVAVGDLNGDDYPDIALLQQLDLDLIYFNDSTGITFPITTTTCRDRMAFNVDLGDVDNDGDLDLIAVGHILNDVCINDGTGHFAERHRIAWRDEARSYSIALGAC